MQNRFLYASSVNMFLSLNMHYELAKVKCSHHINLKINVLEIYFQWGWKIYDQTQEYFDIKITKKGNKLQIESKLLGDRDWTTLNKTKVYSVQPGKILALISVESKKKDSLINFVDKKIFNQNILVNQKKVKNSCIILYLLVNLTYQIWDPWTSPSFWKFPGGGPK